MTDYIAWPPASVPLVGNELVPVIQGGKLVGAPASGIGSAGGTVTSVGLILPPDFNLTGSPITVAGTFTAAWASQTAGTVLAGPVTGPGTPAFRRLVASDLPALGGSYLPITGGTLTGPGNLTVAGTLNAGGNFYAASGIYPSTAGIIWNSPNFTTTFDAANGAYHWTGASGTSVLSLDSVGNLTTVGGVTANSTFVANGPAGTVRSLFWETSGSPRWQFFTDGTAESGANAGSNFALERYDDTGTAIDAVLSIARSSGNVFVTHNCFANDFIINTTKPASQVYAGPTVGSPAAAPAWRQLATTDLSDDVAPTTHTPTFTFGTSVGDLSVAYSSQTGTWYKIGRLVFVTANLVCTPTFTTATGSALLVTTGLPPALGGTTVGFAGRIAGAGVTYAAGQVAVPAFLTGAGSPTFFFSLIASASNVATLTQTNIVSGQIVQMLVTAWYISAT